MQHTSDFKAIWLPFLAVLALAVVLIAGGAHLFSMVSKLRLPPQDYMVAQRAYDGWALFGIPIALSLILTLWLTLIQRATAPRLLWLVAFLCVAGTQAIFWMHTFPMNVATDNWTAMPDNFEIVRQRWEYSHAVAAGLDLVALMSGMLAAMLGARAATAPALRPQV